MTPKKRELFLDTLSAGATVKLAAETAGFTRKHFYAERKKNEAFAAAWDDAVDEGTDVLEQEAFRRAVQGIDDVKSIGYGENAQIVQMKRYSDTLLIFLLKARRPDKYRENVRVEHGGRDGLPIEVKLAFDPGS